MTTQNPITKIKSNFVSTITDRLMEQARAAAATQQNPITVIEKKISSIVSDELIEQAQVAAAMQTAEYAIGERRELLNEIKSLLKEKDAVLVAHFYTSSDLQQLAEETGGCVADSLEMARFGAEHPATTLVVAGVQFMGETAKILSPEKRILMPDKEATCSLDMGCIINRIWTLFFYITPVDKSNPPVAPERLTMLLFSPDWHRKLSLESPC